MFMGSVTPTWFGMSIVTIAGFGAVALWLLFYIVFDYCRYEYYSRRGIDVENGEIPEMPGYYYYPSSESGLIKLTLSERVRLCNCRRTKPLMELKDIMGLDKYSKQDLLATLDFGLIPTHHRSGTKHYSRGEVPKTITVFTNRWRVNHMG